MSQFYAASALLLLSLPYAFAVPLAADGALPGALSNVLPGTPAAALPDTRPNTLPRPISGALPQALPEALPQPLPDFQLFDSTSPVDGVTLPSTDDVSIQTAPAAPAVLYLPEASPSTLEALDVSTLPGGVLTAPDAPVAPGASLPFLPNADVSDLTGGALIEPAIPIDLPSFEPNMEDGTFWGVPENDLSTPAPPSVESAIGAGTWPEALGELPTADATFPTVPSNAIFIDPILSSVAGPTVPTNAIFIDPILSPVTGAPAVLADPPILPSALPAFDYLPEALPEAVPGGLPASSEVNPATLPATPDVVSEASSEAPLHLNQSKFADLLQQISTVIRSFFDVLPDRPAPLTSLPQADASTVLKSRDAASILSLPVPPLGSSLVRRQTHDRDKPNTYPLTGVSHSNPLTGLFLPLLRLMDELLRNIPVVSTASPMTPQEALSALGKRDIATLEPAQAFEILKNLVSLALKVVATLPLPTSAITNAIPLDTALGNIAKRDLTSLDPSIAFDLVKQVLNLLSGIVGNIPIVGDAAETVPIETILSMANGLGKRDVSITPSVAFAILRQILGLAETLILSIPGVPSIIGQSPLDTLATKVPVNSLTSDLPLDETVAKLPLGAVTSALDGVTSKLPVGLIPGVNTKRDLSSLPANAVIELVQQILAMALSLAKTLPGVSDVLSKVSLDQVIGATGGLPLDTLTNLAGGLPARKRDLSDLPVSIDVVTSLLQTLLDLALTVLGSIPIPEDIASLLPLDSATSTLGGLDKRELLLEQQQLIEIATAKSFELQQAITQLKALQVQASQQHHMDKREQLPFDASALTKLSPTIISLLETVLKITETLAIPSAVTDKVSVDKLTGTLGSATGGTGARSEKRTLPADTRILTGLLSSIINILDTFLGLTKSIPAVGGVAGKIAVQPVSALGGATGKLPLDPATVVDKIPVTLSALTGTLGSLGSRSEKRQVPGGLDDTVITSLLTTVINLLSRVLKLTRLPDISTVTSKLPVNPIALASGLPVDPATLASKLPVPVNPPALASGLPVDPATLASKLPVLVNPPALASGLPVDPATLASKLPILVNPLAFTSGLPVDPATLASKLPIDPLSIASGLPVNPLVALGNPLVDPATLVPKIPTNLLGPINILPINPPSLTSILPVDPVSLTNKLPLGGGLGARGGPLRARQILGGLGGLARPLTGSISTLPVGSAIPDVSSPLDTLPILPLNGVPSLNTLPLTLPLNGVPALGTLPVPINSVPLPLGSIVASSVLPSVIPAPLSSAAGPVPNIVNPVLNNAGSSFNVAVPAGPVLNIANPTLNNAGSSFNVAAPARPIVAAAESALAAATPLISAVAPVQSAIAPIQSAIAPVTGALLPILNTPAPIFAAAKPVTDVAKTILPLSVVQQLVGLLKTLLGLESLKIPVVKREATMSKKRQDVSEAFIKKFIADWHTTGAEMTSLSSAAVNSLMQHFLEPSASPLSTVYLKKFPLRFWDFVREYWIFAQIMNNATMEDKVDILRAMFDGTSLNRSDKREMRHGYRYGVGEDGLPDEGVALDDAEKFGEEDFEAIFGPFGSLDPLDLANWVPITELLAPASGKEDALAPTEDSVTADKMDVEATDDVDDDYFDADEFSVEQGIDAHADEFAGDGF
jgi:hypothetical protein